MRKQYIFLNSPIFFSIISSILAIALSIKITPAYAATASNATDNNTATSLVIDDGVIHNVVLSETGETSYNSYKITIQANDVESYSLQISATSDGSSNLSPEHGNTNITGANGKTGSDLTENTWGYGWSNESDEVENLTYYTLPTYGTVGTNINSGLLESAKPESGSVNLVKKLTFAAKFGTDATPGHYTTTVLLSLAVSPKAVASVNPWSTGVFSGITDMQDMTTEVCNQVDTPSAGVTNTPTLTLKDNRDNINYTITKLKDGNCWMAQNLRLDLNSRTLTTANSNVTSNWLSTSGASALWNGSSSSQNIIKQYCDTGSNNYGCYYSWGAAVAGQVSDLTNNNANQSICPRGWQLPTTTQFQTLASGLSTGNDIASAPYNFARAGYAGSGNIGYKGATGYYWSSTIVNNNQAYSLDFDSSKLMPASSGNDRFYGFSVRCVAVN